MTMTDQYLKMGSLQGNGFATLFLSTSSSGTAGTLVTVGTDGKPYGELALDGQTLALAAQGHKVAVLTTSEVISATASWTATPPAPTSAASATWPFMRTAAWR